MKKIYIVNFLILYSSFLYSQNIDLKSDYDIRCSSCPLYNENSNLYKKNKNSIPLKSKSPSTLSSDIEIFPVTGQCAIESMSENSVFIDPNNSDIVLNSNIYNCKPNIFGVSGSLTIDGGFTWNPQFGNPSIGGTADPACAIDLFGNFYVGSLADVLVSTNGGTSWTSYPIPNNGSPDKNHLWVDNNINSPNKNKLYAGWWEQGDGNIYVSRSLNQGQNWSSPINISSMLIPPAQGWNQGVNIQTAPNGDVYATWAIYDDPVSNPLPNEKGIGFAKSSDGITWLPSDVKRIPITIKGIRSTAPPVGSDRVNSFPSMTVNQQNGNIYITWSNQGEPPPNGTNTGDPDIYLIKSIDGGNNWSIPQRINQDTPNNGARQWMSWISCDPFTGMLATIFYDTRISAPTNNMAEAYVAISIDDGNTWTDFPISDFTFDPNPGAFTDYLGIAASSNKIYAVWTDDHSGFPSTYVETIDLNCQANLTLCNGTETGTITYKTSNTINVGGISCNYHITPTANIIMHAGDEILIEGEFFAEGEFYAYIDNCNLLTPRYGINNIDTTIVKNISLANSSFTYYPNPFTDNLHIDFLLEKYSEVKVTVYNSMGKMIETLIQGKYEAGEQTLFFDGSSLAQGVYFVKLDFGDKHYTKAVIKTK